MMVGGKTGTVSSSNSSPATEHCSRPSSQRYDSSLQGESANGGGRPIIHCYKAILLLGKWFPALTVVGGINLKRCIY